MKARSCLPIVVPLPVSAISPSAEPFREAPQGYTLVAEDDCGNFPEGKALPVAEARLKIGPVDLFRPVAPHAHAATFTTPLPAGKTHLQTWFYDAQDNELCGAFYVEVLRK
ncbi:MAG: hypothetical protein ABIP48_01615 [Planctomycetota bacterium]